MIDREKARGVVRRLRDGDDLRRLLDRALDQLPDAAILVVLDGYAWPHDLEGDGTPERDLLEAVDQFRGNSVQGLYYEELDVKSKYHWMKSNGTQQWIAEFHRLIERCDREADAGHLETARVGYGTLFQLLAQLDRGAPRIVFWCGDHGSGQVGVHWPGVLPRWFRCVAAAAPGESYARQVHAVVGYFAHYEWERLLPHAMAAADAEQQRSLASLPPPRKTSELTLA